MVSPLGSTSIHMLFTHSVWELSCFWPHGSVNPFHEVVCLVMRSLQESLSILQSLSQRGVSAYRCQLFYLITKQVILSTPVSQSCKSPAVKGSPCFCWNCIPVDQLCLNIWSICLELSHTGGPLRMRPWVTGCLCFSFCCTTGLTAKWRPAVS